jgi:benzoyl-CoA reductase/2-hydroxyglutaryl-CoA dehydratase subunit BcrC/BadD/HgdB
MTKSKEEKEAKVAHGVLKYMSKLLKPVWYSDINNVINHTCKAIMSLLQEFEQLIEKLKKRMRCGNQGLLTSILIWSKRFWQLLILVKTIPTLPVKLLHEVIALDADEFH